MLFQSGTLLMNQEKVKTPIQVGLFVTCLADLMRPQVAFAAVTLLERAGCRVRVPRQQSCCGQPALNSGDRAATMDIAKNVIQAFDPDDYVVVPSGSCADTLINKYPTLFRHDVQWARRAEDLANKTWELTSFLTEKLGFSLDDVSYPGVCTYHDSCSGLRELGIQKQPRTLLSGVKGLTLSEIQDSNVCCGFGGLFSIKYPDISGRIVSDKCGQITQTDADTVLGGDLGCLLNIAGRLCREGKNIKVFHIAEVLAGMADGPSIGEAERES